MGTLIYTHTILTDTLSFKREEPILLKCLNLIMHHVYCLTKRVCSVELRKSDCSPSNVSESACVRVAEKVKIQTRRSEIHQQNTQVEDRQTDRQTSKGRDKVWDTATHKGLSTSEHWLRLKIKDNVIGVGGQKGA